MNLIAYINKFKSSMPHRKRKQLIRQIDRKLEKISPRLLEAKVCGFSDNNKIFKYKRKLLEARSLLNE